MVSIWTNSQKHLQNEHQIKIYHSKVNNHIKEKFKKCYKYRRKKPDNQLLCLCLHFRNMFDYTHTHTYNKDNKNKSSWIKQKIKNCWVSHRKEMISRFLKIFFRASSRLPLLIEFSNKTCLCKLYVFFYKKKIKEYTFDNIMLII